MNPGRTPSSLLKPPALSYPSRVQPSSSSGRNLRFALLPLSWLVALLVVWLILALTAALQGTTIRPMLHHANHWIIALFFPAILFGNTLGLIAINLLSYVTPPLRRVFDRECKDTGRHGFVRSILDLTRFALVYLAATIVGGVIYFIFGR